MPQYEYESELRTYVSENYRIEESQDIVLAYRKNMVPFKWNSYTEEAKIVNSQVKVSKEKDKLIVALSKEHFEKNVLEHDIKQLVENGLLKSSTGVDGKVTQMQFTSDDTFKVKRRIIVGDESFLPKNYHSIKNAKIVEIYTEALKLDLDDEDALLGFVCRNGLPYSDGLMYANLKTNENPYKDILPNSKPSFGCDEECFCDVEELYRAAYGLWLLQKISQLKYYLQMFETFDFDTKKYERGRHLSEVFVLILQIVLTFDGTVFYNIFQDNYLKGHSDTGNFAYYVTNTLDFSKKDIDASKISEKLYVGEKNWFDKVEQKRKLLGEVAIELYNKQCANLTELLLQGLSVASWHGSALLPSLFTENEWFQDDYYSKDEKYVAIIKEVAQNVYYDILTEAMANANQQQKVTKRGIVYAAQYLPSLLHALFHMAYYNDIGELKKCVECGKLFPAKMRSKTATHCSESCYNKEKQRKKREKEKEQGKTKK